MRGLTLPELLIGLALTLTTLGMVAPAVHATMERQKVRSATMAVMGLLTLARSEALTYSETHLCDANHACERFQQTQKLMVIRGAPAPHQQPLAELTLPAGVSLRWVRFRGQSLRFHRDGRSHYQNGSFIICNRHSARRIVMNWAGRPRVEPYQPDEHC
jgi:type IV fimbrial biogenesis protein FimT